MTVSAMNSETVFDFTFLPRRIRLYRILVDFLPPNNGGIIDKYVLKLNWKVRLECDCCNPVHVLVVIVQLPLIKQCKVIKPLPCLLS